MKKVTTIACALVLITSLFRAQDPVVMTINERPIKKSEFEAVYRKNSGKEANTSSRSVKEYVDLFSLFKSKVFEAESLGLDTLASFRTELAGYRRQLAAPYLTDKNTNESLLNEAYERMKTEVRASHILFRLDETALPKDTLEAWTRANLVRNAIMGKFPTPAEIANYDKLLKNTIEMARLLKGKDSTIYKIKMKSIKNLQEFYASGEDKFVSIAPKTSDDPSVLDNKGDLNYFTVFDMVYPFETAAYTTPIGELSPIVRTKFGYHVIKVYDKRASKGEMTVAHIMVKFAKDATEQDKTNAKIKIDEIYAKIKAGQDFAELARQFSDDKQSSDKGGMLQPFKGGRLPKEFEVTAYALQNNNDVSEPVKTQYGWHVIKRINLKGIAPFDEIKNELKAKVARDSRSQMGRTALIARVKRENNFKENLAARDAFKKIMDTTYLQATWKAERATVLGNKELFNLAGKSYKQSDFAKYLESQMTFRSPTDVFEIVKGIYTTWVNEKVVAFEDSQLENKYVDFANLYREYRDGILLFDLTDQKVWSRAVKDTAGLREYYEKNKTKYLWEERADVTTYKCLNEKIAKELRKLHKEGKAEKEITETLNKTSQLNVTSETVMYLKGENKNIDATWKVGISSSDVKEEKENKVVIYVVNSILPKTPKTLGECRGNLTADYQNYLDVEWLNYLKSKYTVKVNEEVLNTIK